MTSAKRKLPLHDYQSLKRQRSRFSVDQIGQVDRYVQDI